MRLNLEDFDLWNQYATSARTENQLTTGRKAADAISHHRRRNRPQKMHGTAMRSRASSKLTDCDSKRRYRTKGVHSAMNKSAWAVIAKKPMSATTFRNDESGTALTSSPL